MFRVCVVFWFDMCASTWHSQICYQLTFCGCTAACSQIEIPSALIPTLPIPTLVFRDYSKNIWNQGQCVLWTFVPPPSPVFMWAVCAVAVVCQCVPSFIGRPLLTKRHVFCLCCFHPCCLSCSAFSVHTVCVIARSVYYAHMSHADCKAMFSIYVAAASDVVCTLAWSLTVNRDTLTSERSISSV